MRLLVTRPEPDALRLRAALEERGHEATVEPLLSVSFEDTDAIELDGVQALIATSRNALRALKAHPLRGEARKLPLFAVGRATAAEARALGFEMVVTGAGTAQELVAHIVSVSEPSAGLLLHLAGDRHTYKHTFVSSRVFSRWDRRNRNPVRLTAHLIPLPLTGE